MTELNMELLAGMYKNALARIAELEEEKRVANDLSDAEENSLSPAVRNALKRFKNALEIRSLRHENDNLRKALGESAQSLRAIANMAGKDEYLKDVYQIRGYANSRASVAEEAILAVRN